MSRVKLAHEQATAHRRKFSWAPGDIRPLSVTAACLTKACAPPPVGTGGSTSAPMKGTGANANRKRSDQEIIHSLGSGMEPVGFNEGPPPKGISAVALTDDEAEALLDYRFGMYDHINGEMRGNGYAMNLARDKARAHIVKIKQAFQKVEPTTEDLVVHRSSDYPFRSVVRDTGAALIRELPDQFEDLGFVSTSYNSTRLPFGSRQNKLEIRIPKGTKVIKLSNENYEAELLLPPGGTFMKTADDTYVYLSPPGY